MIKISTNLKNLSILVIYFTLNKFLALIKEVILISLFSKSIFFLKYLYLKSIADLFCIFSSPNALQGNIIPQIKPKSEDGTQIDFIFIFRDSVKIGFILFLTSFLICEIFVISDLEMANHIVKYSLLNLSINISIGLIFISSVGNTILQAESKFSKFSKIGIINSIIETILIYPLAFFASFGAAFSRFFGIAFMTYASWKKNIVKIISKDNFVFTPRLNMANFDFGILFYNNLWLISLHFTRVVSGLGNTKSILFFSCATLIVNSIMTIFMQSISSLVISNFIKDKNIFKIGKYLIFSLIINLGTIVFIYFTGNLIVELLFQRGQFDSDYTNETVKILLNLSYPFSIQFMANVLSQPTLTDNSYFQNLNRKITLCICLVFCIYMFYAVFNNIYKSIDSAIFILYFISIINLISAFFGILFLKKR